MSPPRHRLSPARPPTTPATTRVPPPPSRLIPAGPAVSRTPAHSDGLHDSFIRLAVSVARLRADYLAALLATDWAHPDDTACHDLRRRREMYEEARDGFDALRHAIERGYADLTETEAETTP